MARTRFLSLLCLSFLGGPSSPALAQTGTDPAFRWSAQLYGRSVDDTLSNSKTVGAAFGLDAEKVFSGALYGHVRGLALLESGSSSALFTDEFNPNSRLSLVDARLRWTVFGPLAISAGALSQEVLQSPVLIDYATFPAALLSLQWNPDHWYFEGHAQAAIPTGTGLKTKSTGREDTPELFTETAVLGWRRNPDFFLQGRATHFDFRALTHGMAQDSRFYGNSVSGVAAASTFVYRYEGYHLDASGSLPLGAKFALVAGGSFLRNPNAPASANSGRYAYGGFTWAGPGFRLRPIAEWYENQADAGPAFYSSRDFGHNNRRGVGGTLSLQLKEPGLEISVRARRSDLIDDQPFQKNNFRYYDLMVGIPYAPF